MIFLPFLFFFFSFFPFLFVFRSGGALPGVVRFLASFGARLGIVLALFALPYSLLKSKKGLVPAKLFQKTMSMM